MTIVLVVLLLFFLNMSLCKKDGPEKKIDDLINRIADCAEKRDLNCIGSSISLKYRDTENRDKQDLTKYLEDYIEKFRGISVNILGIRIELKTDSEAEASVEVSISSGVAQLFRKILRFYGKIYRIDLKVLKEVDDWKIMSASWVEISPYELLPGSLKVLKKLFPSTF